MEVLHAGDLRIDTRSESVSRDGVILDLPDLSYRLLLSLVRNAPRRVSKDQLIQEVWQGTVVSDETLSQRVRLLRQVLGEDGREPGYVASIRNQGYRLIVPVSHNAGAGEAASASESVAAAALADTGKSRLRSLLLVSAALALLLSLLWFTLGRDIPLQQTPALHSLAILPFEDLSPDGDNLYFADGVHEELLSRLAQIDNFEVVSRTSVLPYRESTMSIPEIGQRLGVSTVMEGSVRLMGNRVRITAQLINADSDRHLWAQSFERELTMENLFAIQEEVATAIAQALEVRLSGEARSKLTHLPTNNLEAYNLYLLGRYHTFLQTAEDLTRAVIFLQQALALDDGFAQAWATLGWAWAFQGAGYGMQPPTAVYPRAREAALRALALDAELAEAHSLYADILTWYDWDWKAAEREYLAAMKLDPFNVLGYSIFLSTQLRHAEATGLIETLLKRFPDSDYAHINAAWRFLNARDYPRALTEAELAHGHVDVLGASGWALLGLGRTLDALDVFEQDAQANPENPSAISNLAIASIRSGDLAGGQSLLAKLLELDKIQFVPPDLVAAVYFELDNADEGFAWLEKALQARTRGLIFMQVDHVYDRYRSDPRYLALLAELKLASP